MHTKELKEISALGAGYAALFLTEGTGLLFRKRWAERLTIVATSSLMPLEVYELVKAFTGVRLLALLINAAVVLYLIYLVRQKENGARDIEGEATRVGVSKPGGERVSNKKEEARL